jgi:glycopeptide antibiotics resistance protein
MMKYIYTDVAAAMRCLPGAVLVGIPLALLVHRLMQKGREKRQGGASFLVTALFCIYLAAMVIITFLSRESGSQIGDVDLKLFSTWGINDRNNAYVVENILLFIPYGFLGSLLFPKLRRFLPGLLAGALASLCIETLQLFTGRGYFQIDDILTNILGTLIGMLLLSFFRLFFI